MIGFTDDIRSIKYVIKNEARDLFLYSSVFISLLVIAFYLFFTLGASEDFAEQVQNKEQVIARNTASSIEVSLDLIGKSLVVLADGSLAGELNDKRAEILTGYASDWSDLVSGALFVNSEGEVVAQSGEQLDLGSDLSDREYVKWASNAQKGQVFYDDPIIARVGPYKGKYLVVIATPVIDARGNFEGTLASGVVVEKLQKNYLDHVLEKKDSQVYIVQDDGTFIYASETELTGENMIEVIADYPFLGNRKIIETLRSRLDGNMEGKLDVYLPKRITGVFPLKRRLIAYSPAHFNGDTWYVAVSYPFSETLLFARPFFVRGTTFLLFSYALLLLFSARIARLKGKKEAESSR